MIQTTEPGRPPFSSLAEPQGEARIDLESLLPRNRPGLRNALRNMWSRARVGLDGQHHQTERREHVNAFLRVTETDGVYMQDTDDLPLPLHDPSPLPAGWTHTGDGWEFCPSGDIMIEVWHVKRIL